MNTDTKSKIEELLNELVSLKGILAGSISTQYNVCGKAGCKCKDPVNPVKHGPYYQLSYTVSGKNSTMFIKEDILDDVNIMRNNYKRFKEICFQLPGLYIDLFRGEGFNAELPDIHNAIESAVTEKQNGQIEKLEDKLGKTRKTIHVQNVTINDIRQSREAWKQKTANAKKKTAELERENTKLNKLLENRENETEKEESKKKRNRRKSETL